MKRLIPALAALLTLSLFGLVFAGPIKTDVLDKAVQINIDGSFSGSGSAVATPAGPRVLTAAHVVAGVATAKEKPVISILWRNRRKTTATIERFGPDLPGKLDLALLKLEDADGVSGAELLAGQAEDGDDCWYCGKSGGPAFQLEKSIVNAQDERYLHCGGAAWFGFSGSGVFVKRGERFFLVATVVGPSESLHANPKSATRCERQLHQFLKGDAK